MCTARQKVFVIYAEVLKAAAIVLSMIQSHLALWRREQGDWKIIFSTYRKSEDIS